GIGLGEAHHLDFPPLGIGEATIHAEEVAGEKGRLLAAGAGPDLEDDVLVVVGIAGEEENLEFLAESGLARLEFGDFGPGHLLDLGIGIAEQLAVPLEIFADPLVLAISLDHSG